MGVLQAGVYPALVTPLDDSGRLAEATLHRLLRHLGRSGVSGFSILGSTGEYPSLSASLRHQLMRRVREEVGPSVLVISGVLETSLPNVVREAHEAADAGMDAILLPPPFYFPMTPGEVGRFYHAVAESSPIPLVLYNIPAFTKVVIPIPVIQEMASHPNVTGLKDSSGDVRYLQACAAATQDEDFLCLTGSDDLLVASLAVGAMGTICSSANVIPEVSIDIIRRWRQGDTAGALAVQQRSARLNEVANRCGGYRAWKACVELLGATPCRVTPPYEEVSEAERQRLQKALEAAEAKAIPAP
ncbi:MAG: dihydrodipicolinate synthase family protein [Firmicutes bacterium]|nr:dihydrodipicolinate synthase family protein [Alicyclobacillaceae bacterium]MCL6497395.1 dihydrodipicolinate synthase family protein [Bacillota bacterium]